MLLDFKYVEFFVANAKQASHFYRSIFGFSGEKTSVSVVPIREYSSL